MALRAACTVAWIHHASDGWSGTHGGSKDSGMSHQSQPYAGSSGLRNSVPSKSKTWSCIKTNHRSQCACEECVVEQQDVAHQEPMGAVSLCQETQGAVPLFVATVCFVTHTVVQGTYDTSANIVVGLLRWSDVLLVR